MVIQSLKGQRWFIWAIVFMLVSGTALVTYINYTSASDSSSDFGPLVIHHVKPAIKAHH